ncbi:MAG: tetratricopeptide repeat protein [Nitrospinota bacterium]
MKEAQESFYGGDFSRAETLFQKVKLQEPENGEALNYLGALASQRGEIELAIAYLGEAIQIRPGDANLHNNLGDFLREKGEMGKAFLSYSRALELDQEYVPARQGIVSILKIQGLETYHPVMDKSLEECFSSPIVDYQDLAAVTALQLKLNPRFGLPLPRGTMIGENWIADLASNPLFLHFLEKTHNTDHEFEPLLTELRRSLLLCHGEFQPLSEAGAKLVSAMALQCFNNEYIFQVEDEEKALLGRLRAGIESGLGAGGNPARELERNLLLFAMYFPLTALSDWRGLSGLGLDRRRPAFRPYSRGRFSSRKGKRS